MPNKDEHFLRLQLYFHGAARAQLKPLAGALGISENTIRNNGNLIKLNGQKITPSKINGRFTYDLEQVASALAIADESAFTSKPRAKQPTQTPRRGRRKKRGLSLDGRSSAGRATA